MKPLIILNFKLYKEAAGKKALDIARQIRNVKHEKYEIIVAPSLCTIQEIAEKTNITVFAQHTDYVPLGAHTGKISAEELKQIGVKGTLLNHSERKIPLPYLTQIVERCKKNKLRTVVCASTISEIKKVAELSPDYIAYEPKELIGGNISVTEADPDIIVKAVGIVHQINPKVKVLCGAGIHSKEDVGHALLLGTHGVLIGHSFVKARDPKKFLQEMLL
ncbi:triose-phosphate isomerase [Candidatus Woesearchaeota archaeon CG10_big_fil_rev_8_21_14_0_10_36_11]|nr:MAG: triose-phosphate isomerase [Candidatus Woesearchaeota archaeon CG10_big_fil_rev_8_21_14_0_10_36_11]